MTAGDRNASALSGAFGIACPRRLRPLLRRAAAQSFEGFGCVSLTGSDAGKVSSRPSSSFLCVLSASTAFLGSAACLSVGAGSNLADMVLSFGWSSQSHVSHIGLAKIFRYGHDLISRYPQWLAAHRVPATIV